MKPKSNLYFRWIFGKVKVWFKQRYTFIEMLKCVIFPLWLFVCSDEFVHQGVAVSGRLKAIPTP
jgi:hypothetical protein